ncbi:MAG: trehalose-phosphatase, partial [Anaerolineae bacterium]
NKGTAFARLIAEYALAAAIYIGDDVTDADALIAAQSLRRGGTCYALGVGVESDDTPAVLQDNADLLVSGVSGVEALLDWLLSVLSAS